MYECNYCQHKALKPADFKLNGAVLCCPVIIQEPAVVRHVDRAGGSVGWSNSPFALDQSQVDLPAHTPLHDAHRLIRPDGSCRLKKKKIKIISTLE